MNEQIIPNDTEHFDISEGVLKEYTGPGGYVAIPEGVTSIRERAFYDCASLTRVTIPEGVTSIGAEAFLGCFALRCASLPGSGLDVGQSAFELCVALEAVEFREGGDAPMALDDYAFQGCRSLRSVRLPNSLRRIGRAAFAKCDSLASITLPASLERLETGAFYSCKGLECVDCRSAALELGDYAFWGCAELGRVSLPEGCTLGRGVFGRCGRIVPVETMSPELAASLGESTAKVPQPRLLTPRHWDYEWAVFGLGDYAPPSYLELDCYGDEAGYASDTMLFHFDIGNIEAAGTTNEDEFDSEAERKSRRDGVWRCLGGMRRKVQAVEADGAVRRCRRQRLSRILSPEQ